MMQLPDVSYLAKLSAKSKERQSEFIGVIDHAFIPIALGDAITTMVNMSMKAYETKSDKVRLYLVADGEKKFNHQHHINGVNYFQHINNILPVYSCFPKLASLHVIRDRNNLDAIIFSMHLQKKTIWPGYEHHTMRTLDYYTHHYINSFFRKNGFIPKIGFPRGYERQVNSFSDLYLKNKFVISVNIRQRQFMSDHCQLERDSPIDQWYRFFDLVRVKYPNVVFVNLGGFSEWDRDLTRKSNVIIPRTLGLGLGEELGILLQSNLFMGTSSGFAAGATFSDVPYVITNYERAVTSRVGINIGENYPFAGKHQTISWEKERTELLMELFEEKYRHLI